jgi:molybdate transport system permease protein
MPSLFDQALIPLLLTLKVSGCATLLVLIVSVVLAYVLTRYKFWGWDILDALLTLPLVMPPTVLGYYLLVLIGKHGWIGHWLYENFNINLIFTWQGAVIAAAVASFPLIYRSVRAGFEDVDHKLENAARVLGASEFEVFTRVTIPLAKNAIIAGTMLAFARAMGEFGATLMVAGSLPGKTQTLSLAVYDAVQVGQNNLANLLVIIASAVCIVVIVTSSKLFGRQYS